eukprot:CAMPEP_0184968168 /NCGR_PEP_ID=MMETSP1098-20130426/1293_1 /TAXON_ID=89044 /ORGANISM="Spumella elongata, Strain CCAP 955/1" /LENGTH=73 /DNA_ID=CAMNT_0027489737 /DNA_START=95 /DNA_END=316 /DNA_ORIENTATION=-
MPETRTGGASRNVHHGNAANRHGGTVPQFHQKDIVSSNKPVHVKHHSSPTQIKAKKATDDMVHDAEEKKKIHV